MKKISTFLLVVICFFSILVIGAAHKNNPGPKWEYACFQYKQTILSMWKTPDITVDDGNITELYKKLGIKSSKLPFPPSFEMLNYAGSQGWELVNIYSEDHSTTGMFMYWFKRPISR